MSNAVEQEIKEERAPLEGFDTRVHIRDVRTGRLVRKQPYRFHVSKQHGGYYERGGNLYYPNGELAKDVNIGKELVTGGRAVTPAKPAEPVVQPVAEKPSAVNPVSATPAIEAPSKPSYSFQK